MQQSAHQLMQFPAALDYVLARWGERNLTARTRAGYRRNLIRLDREIAGGLMQPPAALGPALDAWRAAEQARRAAGEIGNTKIACDVAVLRTFYATLRRKGYPQNPAREIESVKREKRNPRPMPLPLAERLYASIGWATPEARRDRVMVELLGHGLRNHEVGLLDTDAFAAVDSPEGGTFTVTVFGKGQKERMIVVHPVIAPLVAVYLAGRFRVAQWGAWFAAARAAVPRDVDDGAVQAGLGPRLLAELPKKAPVFVTALDTRCSVRWTNAMFAKYRDAAGAGEQWGPHSLRHTSCTEMLRAGVPLAEVRDWHGHESVQTTLGYVKILPEGMLRAISMVARTSALPPAGAPALTPTPSAPQTARAEAA